jgi:ligand-binding sensor domain-containing protein
MNILTKNLLFITVSLSTLFVGCKPDEPMVQVDALPSNVITKIVIDKQGIKWIATDKGLVSFDGTQFKIYSSIPVVYNQPVNDISFDGMSESQQIWSATLQGTLQSNIANQTLTVTASYRQSSGGLLSDTVWVVASDQNRSKFFGTPGGLSIFKSTKWASYDGRWGGNKDNFLTTNQISAIATAKNGWNYVSTKGGGVSRFKFADAISGATKYVLPWASGLSSDNVNTVIVVNDTCQWYGTDRGAAFHSSEYTKADWTSYTTADGLVSDTVYAIAQDALGHTWFGTHRGVSKLANSVFTNFTTKDGLANPKVNTIAVDIDGSIWFGTDNGISHFKNGNWTNYTISR